MASLFIIQCPYCGARDGAEFTYGGDATKHRPDPADGHDADWHDYVYQRDNPKGPHWEYWHHGAGCRQWLKLHRDTVSHEIFEVQMAAPVGKAEKT